jgi:hypothetical protein
MNALVTKVTLLRALAIDRTLLLPAFLRVLRPAPEPENAPELQLLANSTAEWETLVLMCEVRCAICMCIMHACSLLQCCRGSI